MISYIKGEVVSTDDGCMVIECNGIGYLVSATNAALVKFPVGTKATIHTYMQVREDGIGLFGFVSEEERKMFLALTSISGIGPKVGITILSGLTLNDLALSILRGDTATLCSVKGVGKKTAERIVLELKEKVSASEVALKQAIKGKTLNLGFEQTCGANASEAISILQTLGLSRNEAARRVENAVKQGAETTETILTKALKT